MAGSIHAEFVLGPNLFVYSLLAYSKKWDELKQHSK